MHKYFCMLNPLIRYRISQYICKSSLLIMEDNYQQTFVQISVGPIAILPSHCFPTCHIGMTRFQYICMTFQVARIHWANVGNIGTIAIVLPKLAQYGQSRHWYNMQDVMMAILGNHLKIVMTVEPTLEFWYWPSSGLTSGPVLAHACGCWYWLHVGSMLSQHFVYNKSQMLAQFLYNFQQVLSRGLVVLGLKTSILYLWIE